MTLAGLHRDDEPNESVCREGGGDIAAPKLRAISLEGHLLSAVSCALTVVVVGVFSFERGLSEPQVALCVSYALLSVPLGLLLVRRSILVASVIASPLTLYAAIWLVAVPITALPAPLMEPMSPLEILACAGGGLAFNLGALIVSVRTKADEYALVGRPNRLISGPMARLATTLLFVSIAALVANVALEGRVALFDTTAVERKAVAQFIGYPLLSSLGTVSIAIYALTWNFTRFRSLAVATFLILQLLTGQRFVALVALILAAIGYSTFVKVSQRDVRRVFMLAMSVLIAFTFVALFRGGEDDQRRYFIETGIFSGDPRLLQSTEVLRYFGMSQRNMGDVLDGSVAPSANGFYTLSPLTAIGGEVPTGIGTSIYGYTATNIFAYLQADFGSYWPFFVFAFGALSQRIFLRARRRSSVTSGFAWSVVGMGLATSFFAYVHAYVYWAALFPLLVLCSEAFLRAARGRSSLRVKMKSPQSVTARTGQVRA